MISLHMQLWNAVWYFRRCLAVLHAAIDVTKRHAPKWLAIAIPIALAIPGPQDEAVVALMIAWLWWRRPLMRAEMKQRVADAWNGVL
jgi:hypothetical protein